MLQGRFVHVINFWQWCIVWTLRWWHSTKKTVTRPRWMWGSVCETCMNMNGYPSTSCLRWCRAGMTTRSTAWSMKIMWAGGSRMSSALILLRWKMMGWGGAWAAAAAAAPSQRGWSRERSGCSACAAFASVRCPSVTRWWRSYRTWWIITLRAGGWRSISTTTRSGSRGRAIRSPSLRHGDQFLELLDLDGSSGLLYQSKQATKLFSWADQDCVPVEFTWRELAACNPLLCLLSYLTQRSLGLPLPSNKLQ